MTDEVTATLAEVAAALPGGGESRPGQRQMAAAVGRAIAERPPPGGPGRHRHRQITGLPIPAALAGQRVVVATATKALQDQLATNDLPLVADGHRAGPSFAVLKGRSNYLCRQRVAEIGGRGEQLSLTPAGADPPDADDALTRPSRHRSRERPGRRRTWSTAVGSVTRSGGWCGGPRRRPPATGPSSSSNRTSGPGPWSRPPPASARGPSAAPRAATASPRTPGPGPPTADVVVVNTHLYGAHLASGGAVLPPHEVVVFDEAHEVEEVMTDSLGVDIGPGRFRALAATARPLLDPGWPGAVDAADAVSEVGDLFQRAIAPAGRAARPTRRDRRGRSGPTRPRRTAAG